MVSVVAGCLLTDGVLIAADTRITYPSAGGSEIHVDNAIKIFPFASGTAIGYVGDVGTASVLLQHLISGPDRMARTDPISLSNWMPRLLRSVYSRLQPHLMREVTSMAGRSDPAAYM